MKIWQKKERKDAELLGAKQTPRSGGLWFAKGDSKSSKYLIENKTSKHDSFTIPRKMWEKLEKEALLSRRIPLLSIQFGEKDTELIILSKNDFIELLFKI